MLCEVQHNAALPRTVQIPSSLGPVISLVSRDRVYIRCDGGREELYDLLHDPLESVDLAKHPESRQAIDRFREELSRRGGGMTTPCALEESYAEAGSFEAARKWQTNAHELGETQRDQ